MNKDDITHLAALARVRLSEVELEQFAEELPAIVDYVGVVNSIAQGADVEPSAGVRPNVFRDDKVTTEPEQFSEAIIAQMPRSTGRFLAVPKILQTED